MEIKNHVSTWRSVASANLPAEPLAYFRRYIAPLLLAICVLAGLLETFVDLVPDDPIFWVVTPLRLIVGLGLVIAVVAAPAVATFRTILDWPLGLLLVVAASSVVLSEGSWSLWRALLTGIALYYLTVATWRLVPANGRTALLTVMAGILLASAIVGVSQTVNETPTGFCRSFFNPAIDSCTSSQTLDRAIGTQTNPNLLAALIVLLLPITGYVVHKWHDKYHQLFGWLGIGLAVIALLFTMSRNAAVACLVSVGAFFVFRRFRNQKVLLFGGAGLFTVVAIVIVRLFNAGAAEDIRAAIYRAGIKTFLANPLGVGLGSAGTAIKTRLPNSLDFAHAHNLWLHWLIEVGVLGALVWVAIPLLIIRHLLKSASVGHSLAPWLGAALAGFLMVSFLDHPANANRIMYLMWVTFAVMAAQPTAAKPDDQHPVVDQALPPLAVPTQSVPVSTVPSKHHPDEAFPRPFAEPAAGPRADQLLTSLDPPAAHPIEPEPDTLHIPPPPQPATRLPQFRPAPHIGASREQNSHQ